MINQSMAPKMTRFAERYAECLDATKAARDAGYSNKTAQEQGARLVKNPRVRAVIRDHQKRLADATFVDAVNVIRDLTDIAFADPADLVALTRESCRYCHGAHHAYQWINEAEFAKAVARFGDEIGALSGGALQAAQGAAPNSSGGFGFNPRREPHEGCPGCRGEGIEAVWRADVKRLFGPARKLFAGIKETKDGVQILMRDQDKALEMLGRHLGMFNDKLLLKGDVENPIALLIQQVQGSALKPVLNPVEDE